MQFESRFVICAESNREKEELLNLEVDSRRAAVVVAEEAAKSFGAGDGNRHVERFFGWFD